MSYATQALKQALLHDEGAATLYLSPHIPGLGAARDVLRAAFGNQDVFLAQVQEVPPPADAPEGVDLLCLGGKGDIFNYQALDVYLEFGLRDSNLLTMLILVPLPQQWDVHKVFDTLSPDILPAQGTFTQATIVISYGLAAVPDSQIISEYDRQNPNRVDIARYPLQNGLQILAADVAAVGGAVDDEVLKEAQAAGIPPSHLPELTTLPNRVEIRADVHAGWLVLERWWGKMKPASSLAENVYPVGLAYRYSLTDADDFYHYWLLEVGAPEQPIVLEARVLDMDMVGQPNAFFPVRYTSRFATRTPLKQAAQALAALLGEQAIIFAAQGLELPDDITLLGFSYAPGEWLQCTFAAGDFTRQDAYLLHAGPLELREVDFTVWAPIDKPDAFASIELEATTSFFGEQFRVRVRPWTFIEGGLDDLDGVDLGGLVDKLLPAPLPFGLDSVRLTQAWVSHAMSSREGEASFTSLTLRLDGKVELLPGAIELDEIALFLSEDSDGSKNASLSAQFRLGSSIAMAALASYDGGDWVFSGEVGGEGEGVPIKDLIDQIAQLFGATVPAKDVIPDVALESFSLQYETQSRTLTIHAVADWKIPDDIPVLGETDNRVLLQVTTAPTSQQGESDTALTIDWTLQKGKYELDANVALAKEAQTYSVDFSAPDPDQPVALTDLTSAIGLPDIPKPEAGLLDSIFEVSHLALDYDHTEKTFSVAWSRPLGAGIFLVEYSQSGSSQPDHAGGSAPSGAANRFVKVSWLGNEETSTLGIQEILKLAGQEDLENDLKDMVGDEIVTKIDDFLNFKQLGFRWQENDQQDILTFTALSKSQAQAFIAVRSGENAGLVAGIAFAGSDEEPAHSMADDLTFLPEAVNKFLKVVEEVLEHIELTHFLFSTVSSSAYQPPAFAASALQPSYARQDATAPSYPFGAGTMALGQGVSVGVRVKFGKHDIVRRLIDLDELDGQVTIGEVMAVQVSIPGSLKLDAGGGNSLALTSPMLRIKDNLEIPEAGPEFDIMGGLDIHFSGQRLQMAGWLALAEESLTGHIQLTELALPIPLTPIYLLPGVQLVINKDKPLSLDLGLQFEPSGLDLGLSGSFAIYKDDKDLVYGDAGFVLELVEEIPQPLYVEFGTDELSIPVLLEAVTGLQYRLHLADSAAKLAAEGAEAAEEAAGAVADLAGGEAGSAVKAESEVADKAAKGASAAIEAAESALGHLEAILSKVELREVRFHWADSIVNLPDGSTVMPGVGIRGGLRIFDWDAFAVLDLSTQGIPGFSGHLEAEKIEMGRVLKIWGDGKGIHRTPSTAEDFNKQVKSKVDAMAAGQQKPATPADAAGGARDEGDWFLEPGGPVLHLSTRSAPFLHADLHAQLFGFLQTDIHADITEEGFDFDFKIGAGNAVTAELECHWWHKEGKLEAHGDLGIHLHGDIGPIIPHVAATEFHLDTDLDAHVSLMVDSKEFKLTVNGSFEYQGASLHLPELVLEEQFSTLEEMAKKIWEHVVAEAENIFEEYLAPIGKFVAEGAEEVKQVAVAAAKDVAEVASAAAGEAKQIVSDVADTMNKAAGDIGQAAQNLAGEAETLASHAAQAALDAAAPLLEKVSDLGSKALQFATDAADSVKAIVADAVALVSEAAHYAIRVAAEAAQWVAGKLDDARRWVSARLDQAIALVNELAQEAEAAVRAIEADIEEIENKIKELFSRAAEEVEDTLSGGWHAATSWL